MNSQSDHEPKLLASFRFDPGLDIFLAQEQRGKQCSHPFPATANLKHVIEALGVPHTEVGLVLVNGLPTDMDRRLHAGDRVTVHPHWPGDHRDEVLRFAADAHLGGLARLLRMAGFDTTYDNGWQDAALVASALAEERVVLSRDRDLLKRRDVLRGCHLRALDPEEQLLELGDRYPLANNARPLSLCLACNLPLAAVEKHSVRERIPPAVQALHERFMSCPSCRRIYWEGSHWQHMRARLKELLREPLSASGSG